MSANGDFRTPAQHDTDRIQYSSALRRLDGVTQVVAVGERMLLHNRLTHTIKVAQLSRRISQYLLHQHPGLDLDPDAAEAAGLAHDLGHPPFGHIAEHALNDVMGQYTDGYEGNAQSFRIVTKLSRSRHAAGLHLTDRTLNGILKYPWMHGAAGAPSANKWGAYASELPDFDRVRAGAVPFAKSLEAEVMDWADDISYAVHDLQDFYRAGIIPLELLRDREDDREEFVGRVLEDLRDPLHPDLPTVSSDDALSTLSKIFNLTQVTSTETGSMDHRDQVSRMGSNLINHFVKQTSVDARGQFDVPALGRLQVHILKQLTWQHVIQNPALATVQEGQVALIKELFHRLYRWLEVETKLQRLPTRLRELESFIKSDEADSTGEAQRARAVGDYLSGLTENQALDLSARLNGTTLSSIQDSWLAT